jgi:hypothetical protein
VNEPSQVHTHTALSRQDSSNEVLADATSDLQRPDDGQHFAKLPEPDFGRTPLSFEPEISQASEVGGAAFLEYQPDLSSKFFWLKDPSGTERVLPQQRFGKCMSPRLGVGTGVATRDGEPVLPSTGIHLTPSQPGSTQTLFCLEPESTSTVPPQHGLAGCREQAPLQTVRETEGEANSHAADAAGPGEDLDCFELFFWLKGGN